MSTSQFAGALGPESERVLTILKRELMNGTYVPGEKFPSERQLCRRFGVSRPTIRRAVQRLANEDLLSIRQRSGMVVTEKSAGVRVIAVMCAIDGPILQMAHDEAMDMGFIVAFYNQSHHEWSLEDEERFLRQTMEQRHRGVMAHCSPYGDSHSALLSQLVERGVRVVHIEHSTTEVPSQSYVLPDYRLSGYQAAQYLYNSGYQEVFFATAQEKAPFSRLIEKGVAEAVGERNGVYQPQRHLLPILPGLAHSTRAIRKVMEFADRFESSVGIVCAEDFAVELADHLNRFGFNIPEKVGIVAHDPFGSPIEGVDMMRFDRRAIVRRSVKYIEDSSAPPVRELIPPELVKAGSVKKPVSPPLNS